MSETQLIFSQKVASAVQAVQFRACPVPPGYRVYIRPLPGNVGAVTIADTLNAALNGPNTFVNKTDIEREYPVENFSKICIAAQNVGDGLEAVARPAAPAGVSAAKTPNTDGYRPAPPQP